MGKGPGIAKAVVRELASRTHEAMRAGRMRVEASMALIEVCRFIASEERKALALEIEPRERRRG